MDDPKSGQHSRFRFDLRQVFYVTSLLAAGMAFSPFTIPLSIFVLLIWWGCFTALRFPKFRSSLLLIVFFTLLGTCCVGVSLPAVSRVREASRRTVCLNNMKQIGLALLNYESANGEFPTPKIGRKFPYSWRVEILPFIEQVNWRKLYDTNRAWDSPENMTWAESAVYCFSCPSLDHGAKTPYKLVTGLGTVFDDDEPAKFGKVLDGTSNTIMLIEDHSNPVSIADPDGDLNIDQAVKLLSECSPGNSVHCFENMFSTTYPGTHVLFFDGTTEIIGFNADPQVLRNLFLCADGDIPEVDPSEIGEPIVVYKYGAIVSFVAYLVLILLPIFPLVNQWRQSSRRFKIETLPET